MDHQLSFDTVDQYNTFNDHLTRHPLISVVDFAKAPPRHRSRMRFGFYAIMLKDQKTGDIRYGRHYYDYQNGTMLFFAPGQVVNVEYEDDFYQPLGYALVIHPDLLHGMPLGQNIQDYPFFGYQVHEALHLSDSERATVLDCYAKIDTELHQSIDQHSKRILVAQVEVLLNYCLRFYDRQFITRNYVNKGILERFENLLRDYFTSGRPDFLGLPTVGWCASELNLSASYFGELIKKDTGKSALEYIQDRVINEGKARLFDNNKSVSEVAYELGFKYPNHFTRLFKQHVGITPNQYKTGIQ
ncbi:MAG: helix-turn-helix domain-containing protein [Dyadobacter sp.]|uniref:helix-turn-helix domain-containing protein n=1 Tax=Dyadobacter sp. TaxID=1914288 RepID=UPI001B1763CE|nr:helix-turn-helix domain-containing protein [Dyadobacter sp.]MBO9616241.1 helix-turn-helix domain-containing protein [Dyadobacter sp.]